MHSVILSTFIKLPIVIKIFVMFTFEQPFYKGFKLLVVGCRLPDCEVVDSTLVGRSTTAIFRGNSLRHSMDVANT